MRGPIGPVFSLTSSRSPEHEPLSLWKNLLIGFVLLMGLLYTLPNFYGEVPAVQVSSGKATLKLDPTAVTARVEEALSGAGIANTGIFVDPTSVRARFASTDVQLKAKDAIERALNPDPADPPTSSRSTCCPPRRTGSPA